MVALYVGDGEGLANAVGFGNRVSVHDGDFEAAWVAPRSERLVEVREIEQKGASGASGANNQHPHAVAKQVFLDGVFNLHEGSR